MAETNNLPNNGADTQAAPPEAAPPTAAPSLAAPPVAAPPVAAPPVAAQPVAAQPVAGQPVAGQPVAGQPVGAQPVAGQPVAALGDDPSADQGECPDDPKNANRIMSKNCAPTWMILLLALYALAGTFVVLWIVHSNWCEATPGPKRTVASAENTPKQPTDQKGASGGIGAASGASATSGTTGSTGKTGASGPTGPTSPPGVLGATAAGAATGTPGASGPTGNTGCTECPTEQSILGMIILLGALGGFIHLCASLSQFVGNRALRTSWVLYYVFMPFEGAALAPLMVLLLRVGVLNMNAPATAQGQCATANLNLMGLYAFAGLTGLFSKQAIEKLATVFSKVNASDSIQSSNKQPPGGPDPKGGK